MARTHLITIVDDKFDDFKNGLTFCAILKAERSIAQGDKIIFENSKQDQFEAVVASVSSPAGLLKHWVLIEIQQSNEE